MVFRHDRTAGLARREGKGITINRDMAENRFPAGLIGYNRRHP